MMSTVTSSMMSNVTSSIMSTYEYHPGLKKLRNVMVVIPHGHITRRKLVMVLNEQR
jgi:hypothetical protein